MSEHLVPTWNRRVATAALVVATACTGGQSGSMTSAVSEAAPSVPTTQPEAGQPIMPDISSIQAEIIEKYKDRPIALYAWGAGLVVGCNNNDFRREDGSIDSSIYDAALQGLVGRISDESGHELTPQELNEFAVGYQEGLDFGINESGDPNSRICRSEQPGDFSLTA